MISIFFGVSLAVGGWPLAFPNSAIPAGGLVFKLQLAGVEENTLKREHPHSSFVICHLSFVIRHSSFVIQDNQSSLPMQLKI
ncbi:MAG: hypothetical protein ACE5IY_23490 [bacterium]